MHNQNMTWERGQVVNIEGRDYRIVNMAIDQVSGKSEARLYVDLEQVENG